MKRVSCCASALAALFLAPSAGADIRVGVADDHPKSPDIAGRFYDTMKDVGLSENRVTIVWDSSHPTEIENEAGVAHAVARRRRRRRQAHARAVPVEGARARGLGRTGEVRRLDGPRRAGLSGGEGHHRRQRAEQVPLLAAPVPSQRQRRRLRRLRARARGVLRRDQERRPLDHGDRDRPRPARHRQPSRSREPLHLAGPLHSRHRPRVPQDQAEEADHGRAELPPVSERVHRQARDGLRVAERGHSEPRPHQAGGLGRVQRHGAADVPRGRHAPGAGAHAQAAPERGRLAGRHPAGAHAAPTSARRASSRPTRGRRPRSTGT